MEVRIVTSARQIDIDSTCHDLFIIVSEMFHFPARPATGERLRILSRTRAIRTCASRGLLPLVVRYLHDYGLRSGVARFVLYSHDHFINSSVEILSKTARLQLQRERILPVGCD